MTDTPEPSDRVGVASVPPDPSRSREVRKAYRTFALILVGWASYTTVWSWLSWLRFSAFRASIYDFGVFAQSGWRVYAGNLSFEQLVLVFFNLGGSMLLAPLTIGGYIVTLVVQSAALGLGGVFVYLIGRRYGLSPGATSALALAYWLYFPLSGLNFTDAHYEAFLVPFFLGGVWLFLEGRFVGAFALLTAAAVLKYPLSAYPLLFGLMVLAPGLAGRFIARLDRSSARGRLKALVRNAAERIRRHPLRATRRPAPSWFAFGLPMVCLGILLGGLLSNSIYYPGTNASSLAHAVSFNPWVNGTTKVETLLLLLAPLGFLPLLAPRWLLFTAPYAAVLVFVNYIGYTYPLIVTSWYGFLVIPFVAIGTVESVARLETGSTWVQRLWAALFRRRPSSHSRELSAEFARNLRARRAGRRWRPMIGRTVRTPSSIAVLVLVLSVGASAFFNPLGPFNSETRASFDTQQLFTSNESLYDHFVRLAELIPRNDPAVILQDNMPELLPRPLMPGSLSPLVAGPFGQVAYNLTWPNRNGGWSPIDPDYVIGNPNPLPDSFFDAPGPYPYNISMQDILSRLYGSYQYGILGQADGMMVLEHHYTGPIEYYVPFTESLPPSAFRSFAGTFNASSCQSPCLSITGLTTGSTSWYGPYSYLAPGTYRVEFDLGISGWAPGDHLTVDVSSAFGKTILASRVVTTPRALVSEIREVVNVTANVSNGAAAVEFRGVSTFVNGSVSLYGIRVTEIAPPPTVYRVGDSAHDRAVYEVLNLTPPGATVLTDPADAVYFDDRSPVNVTALGARPLPEYAVYDPAAGSDCAPGLETLCSVVNASYVRGLYGIAAEVDGVALLEGGSPALSTYLPFVPALPVTDLRTSGGAGQIDTRVANGSLIVENQTNGGYSWFGPYLGLPPGNYSVAFSLSASNTSATNHIRVDVAQWNGRGGLATFLVNGTALAPSGSVDRIVLDFDLREFSSSIEFRGFATVWEGDLVLNAIDVEQLGAP